MQANGIEKSKIHILVDIIEYVTNSVVSKTIMLKTNGKISIMAIDSGKELSGKISPFDTFIQIIEGTAEVVIDDQSNILHTGQGIIIPAHASNIIRSIGRFKMLSTVIKSGYEEGTL